MSETHPLSVNWTRLEREGKARAVLDALKAWRAGTANEAQQKLAWQAVQQIFCGVDALSWRDESHRLTDALEGRRSVALQLQRATNLSYGELTGKNEDLEMKHG